MSDEKSDLHRSMTDFDFESRLPRITFRNGSPRGIPWGMIRDGTEYVIATEHDAVVRCNQRLVAALLEACDLLAAGVDGIEMIADTVRRFQDPDLVTESPEAIRRQIGEWRALAHEEGETRVD